LQKKPPDGESRQGVFVYWRGKLIEAGNEPVCSQGLAGLSVSAAPDLVLNLAEFSG